MNTIIIIIASVLFGIACLFIYVCIGFMQLFFERVITKDAEDKSYTTVYQRILWKKSGQIGMKYPEYQFSRKHPEFIKYENKLQNIIIAFWPVFAVAETINHYITHREK